MNNPVITSSDISWASQACIKYWDEVKNDPIGRLRLADAYLARITVGDYSQRWERTDWLRSSIGPHVRAADPAAILGDPHLCGMIRQLWGEAGIIRLRTRVEKKSA